MGSVTMPARPFRQGMAIGVIERWVCCHCRCTIDPPTETRKLWRLYAHVNRPCGCWAPIEKVDD